MTEKKSPRIFTFDLLRGYFLVAIILDHLAYYPNGLDWWSGRGALFVSAAEGFFLISGIVLGIVRGAKLADKPFIISARLLLKRSLQLYITAIVLMFFFTLIGWLFLDNPGLKAGIRSPDENLLRIIWGALTFEYIYGWADYLRLYAIFIFFSPIAIWLLRKKLWYVIILTSILIWTQFYNSPLGSEELSQVFSWQIIFFSGLIIGFHWDSIVVWWQSLNRVFKKCLLAVIITTAAITMGINFLMLYGESLLGFPSPFLPDIYTDLKPLFDKEALPVARILLFALWFIAGFWIFTRFEKLIIRKLGWILLPFGTNSLYVYTLHAIVIFFIHLIMKEETSYGLLNFLLSVAVVLLIWLAVKYEILMKIIPR